MSYWMAVRRRLAAIALAGINVAALAIAYTGNMTDEIVTMGDGNDYRLLTLTSSGTLSIDQPVVADVWLCGGGSQGTQCNYSKPISGGAGAYVNSAYGVSIQNGAAVVGAATGASSFGSVTANGASGKNGGSGGGESGNNLGDTPGTGAGVATYPFGDTIFFAGKAHCAGGAGGSYSSSSRSSQGGVGGTNGGNGGEGANGSTSAALGGSFGGGKGGTPGSAGGNATFYGSGGGGGGLKASSVYGGAGGAGGSGYQGVIYVRIPLNQAA